MEIQLSQIEEDIRILGITETFDFDRRPIFSDCLCLMGPTE
jgi:hypothetical protein